MNGCHNGPKLKEALEGREAEESSNIERPECAWSFLRIMLFNFVDRTREKQMENS